MTNQEIDNELRLLRRDFASFAVQMHKDLGDFKADLLKTIWITQLSTLGIILIGVGLLIHFKV